MYIYINAHKELLGIGYINIFPVSFDFFMMGFFSTTPPKVNHRSTVYCFFFYKNPIFFISFISFYDKISASTIYRMKL